MKEPRWAPGPWDYRPGEFDDWGWIRGPDGLTIGHAHSPLDDEEADRHRAAKTDPYEANARLMAASPALYSALSTALDLMEGMLIGAAMLRGKTGTIKVSDPPEMAALRAALAKARGEPADG